MFGIECPVPIMGPSAAWSSIAVGAGEMKIIMGILSAFAVISASGCSSRQNVRCRGVFSNKEIQNGKIQNEQTSDNAAFGFNVERSPVWANLFSKKDWKGFVNISYVSAPYAYTNKRGGAILEILTDNGSSVSASKSENNNAQLFSYDDVDGAVEYFETQNGSTNSFSGLCPKV